MKKLFKLKRLLRARNKSGFTLVEVIISCSLLAILVLGIMTFVTPVLKMLSSGQKNARATMLAETVDTYISGVLRTAAAVEVFENVPIASSSNANLSMATYGSGISNISDFMSTPTDTGVKGDTYEVRALGIITQNDGELNRQGVRIYNMEVDQSSYAVLMSTKSSAFHNTMFEGLYATVSIETFASEEDGVTGNARGYKVLTTVYTDPKCYDIAEETRDKSLKVFDGITFFENLNFDANGAHDVIPVAATMQDAMNAYAESGADGLFYPATIIYYVAPKK